MLSCYCLVQKCERDQRPEIEVVVYTFIHNNRMYSVLDKITDNRL